MIAEVFGYLGAAFLTFTLIPQLYHTVKTKKVQDISPYSAQTGPAKRNDQVTINHHLRTLESHPEYQSIYEQLTKSIKNTHGFKKL